MFAHSRPADNNPIVVDLDEDIMQTGLTGVGKRLTDRTTLVGSLASMG